MSRIPGEGLLTKEGRFPTARLNDDGGRKPPLLEVGTVGRLCQTA